MVALWNSVVCWFLISVTTAKNATKESIGFPEPEEDVNLVNKDNRQPVFIPAMCPVNELFYPGDQKDDWICDCRPGYLYHPNTDTCWAAYRKGPCEVSYYLVLPQDTAIPICEKNPCETDGHVMYNGRCERLGMIYPCRQLWPIPAALTVNSTTLTITCERINLESRFGGEASAKSITTECLPGCKRNINGKCLAVKL